MENTSSKAYFSALYDEAFTLLVEARGYIVDLRQNGDRSGLKSTDYLDVTLETMRLTSRLTQVMAWILAQKAVHNGEMSVEEGASEKHRLSGQTICLQRESAAAGHLPPRLGELLRRSYELYCRVNRLDEQIQIRLAAPAEDRPEQSPDRPRLRAVTTSGQTPRSAY